MIKNVDFGDGLKNLSAQIKGSGYVDFCLDNNLSEKLAHFELNSKNYTKMDFDVIETVTGVHNVFILFSNADICLKNWICNK